MAFPIVAIGASAGGLEAISEVLVALPRASPLAYVVLQHLDPEHRSQLAEILAQHTAMPVATIREGMTVESGHVYVLPENVTLTLSDDRFHLTPRGGGRHHPIDAFFISLAEARADAAIGVVLSGADADGTVGLQAIKRAGGITLRPDAGIGPVCRDAAKRHRERFCRFRAEPAGDCPRAHALGEPPVSGTA